MPAYIKRLVIILLSFLVFSNPLYAATSDSDTSKVTATIPDFVAPSAPVLVAPTNNSFINAHPTFIFKRATDRDSSISYNLYLDGQLLFEGISDSANKLGTNYSSTLNTSENTISVLPTPMTLVSEGVHSWKVVAIDAAGNKTNSATWTFTLDLTPPYILINKIGPYTNLSLSSQDPATVPPNTSFQIKGPAYITFVGTTEPLSTVQLTTSESNNKTKTYTTTADAQGNFQFDLYFELGRHSISVVSIDQAANTSALPDFTLLISKDAPSAPSAPGQPPGLPASLYQIIPPQLSALLRLIEQSPGLQAAILISLLALAIALLIFLLWKKPKNLQILNLATAKPVAAAKIQVPNQITTTNRRGLAYIPNLQKGTTMNITLPETSTTISLCVSSLEYPFLTLRL